MAKSICRTHLMILSLALVATLNAQAQQLSPPCTSAADCRARIAQGQTTLNTFLAGQAPTFLDIVKDADGSVKYMNQYDAVQYCAAQGAHLPSARELARLSMSLGAKGISEVTAPKPDISYYKISAKNADGSLDEFYFSYVGYQRPTSELGNNWFWSSSVGSVNSDFGFLLSGYGGDVFNYYRNSRVPVRCVAGR